MLRKRRLQRNFAIFAIFLMLLSISVPPSVVYATEGQPETKEEKLELEKQLEQQAESGEAEADPAVAEDELENMLSGLGIEQPEQQKSKESAKQEKVEAEVKTILKKKEKVDVIIRMKDKPELDKLYPQTKSLQKRSEKLAFVKEKLEDKAEKSQSGLDKALAALEKDGKAEKKSTLWIINGAAATVDQDALNELEQREDIESITLDEVIELPEITVEESGPRLPEWGLEKIYATKVWGEYGLQGDGIVVGIMDSGVDATHEALKDNYRGKDGAHQFSWIDVSGQDYETPKDGNGHGTHVAGTVLGGGSGKPIGVAPEAEWIAAKIFDDIGRASTSGIHEAFQWFMAPGGDPSKAPHVVNNSWGNSNTYSMEFYDDVKAWVSAGIFPVFSAGNDGPGTETIGAPGSFPASFTVGATDRFDQIAPFSSRGPVYWPDENGETKQMIKPDIVAPGHEIYSAMSSQIGNEKYFTLSGTSMAAPHVTGAVALLYQSNPDLDIDEVKQLLLNTARQDTYMGELPNSVYGKGIINIYQAVTETAYAGELTGVLKNEEGEPIEGTLSLDDMEYKIPADGAFSFKVKEGTYDAVVESFGYEDLEVEVEVTQGETTSVEWTLQKSAAYEVTGQVVDQDGNPVAYAYLRVKDTPLPVSRTNADGEFSLGEVPVGTYEIQVTGSGIEGVTSEVAVDGEKQLTIEVVRKDAASSSAMWETANNNAARNAVSPHSIDLDALNDAWTYESGSKGPLLFTTPAANNEQIVAVTEYGWVVSLDTQTGEEMWAVRLGNDNRSTPTLADGKVFVSGGADGNIHALDATNGRVLWSTDVGSPAIYEAPVLKDGKLYVSSGLDGNAKLTALDAASGDELWNVPLEAPTYAGPTLGDGMLFVGSFNNEKLRAFSMEDGTEVWSKTMEGEGFLSKTVYHEGTLYASASSTTMDDGTLYAFDAATGDELWRAADVGDSQAASPIVYENMVIATSASEPLLRAFDKQTGELVWTNTEVGASYNNGSISANGILFYAGKDGKFSGLDVYTGEVLTSYTLPVYSTSNLPILSGQVVVPYRAGIQSYMAPGIMTGTVTDADGNGLDAVLSIEETGYEVTAAEDGTYTINHEPGEYTVKVSEYGYKQEETTVEFVSGFSRAQDFTLEAAEEGALQVEVTDARTGEALEGVSVEVNGTPVQGTTDDQGLFTEENVYEGTFGISLTLDGYVALSEELTVVAGETTTVSYSMQPIDVAVLDDYESEVTKFLQLNGVTAEEREWDIVEDIDRYQMVYLNGAYRTGGVQPTKEQVDALIAAAEEHGVSLIFTDQWGGSYGSIEHLYDFYENPKKFGEHSGDGTVRLEVETVHPIFEGWEIGDRLDLYDRDGYFAWFNQYDGSALAKIGSTEAGYLGTGVAYKAVAEDSAHMLLAAHGAAPWVSPLQGWKQDQQQLLLNTVDYLRDVAFGLVDGTVVDAGGEPIDATIEVLETGTKVETSEGAFEFFHDLGTYTLEVRAAGFATKTVEIEVGSENDALSIEMERTDGGTVAGLVSDSVTGEPLEGAAVKVLNLDGEVVKETTTSSNGRYEVAGLAEAVHVLQVSMDGYISEEKEIDVARIKGDQNVELYPVPAVAVVGDDYNDSRNFRSVMADAGIEAVEVDEEEIAGQIGEYDVVFVNDPSTVYFKKEQFEAMMAEADKQKTSVIFGDTYYSGSGINHLVKHRQDPENRTTLRDRSKLTEYVVTEAHPIFDGVAEGETIEILKPDGGSIAAFDGYSGKPLADIQQEGMEEPLGTGIAYKARTGESLELLMSGHGYSFIRNKEDYTEAGNNLIVNAVLWAANAEFATVSGTVVNDEGEPLEATVKVVGEEVEKETDPETGAFEIALDEGTYELEIHSYGYETKTITLESTMGSETQTIEVDVAEDAGSLSGVVENERDGNAVEGVAVTLEGTPREAVTTTQGTFELEHLLPGDYTLSLEKEGFVDKKVEVSLSANEEVTLNLTMKPSPLVGVIGEVNSSSYVSVKEYLRDKGYQAEDMTYTDLDKLEEVDLVFANNDYDRDAEPSKQELDAFIQALDETKTSIIWTGQHGGRGAIDFLSDFYNDPDAVFSGSDAGASATVTKAHPLTEGLDPETTFDVESKYNYYYGFDGYSGETVVDMTHEANGESGSMVAFKGRTTESVEVLMANFTFSSVFHPGDYFDENREKLLQNALEWTTSDREPLVGELHGKVENEQGMAVKAAITVEETGDTIDTNDEGEFFVGLEAGTYQLSVEAFGHVDQTFEVTIENGQVLNETFTLQTDNAGTITGTVIDSQTNAPIEGAGVQLVGTPLEVTTDENGSYELVAPEGQYELRVVAEGYAPRGSSVDVTAGETIEVNVTLVQAQKIAVLANSYQQDRIMPFLESNGYDVDFYDYRDHQELDGALANYELVILNDTSSSMSDEQFGAFIEKADANEVSLIFPGQYSFGTLGDLSDVTGDPEDAIGGFAPDSIKLKVESNHPILKGYNVGDEVEILTRPNSNAQYGVYENYSGTTIASLTNDEVGPLGDSIGFNYSSANSVHVLLSTLHIGGYGNPNERWTEDTEQIYLNALDFAMTASLGEITGTVTDEAGEPVVGAQVTLEGQNKQTTTDVNGNYRFGVGVGEYEVSVLARGYEAASKTVEVAELGDAVVADFTLAEIEGVSLAGVVTDRETGEPVSDATVTLTPVENENFKEEVMTGEDGAYAFDQLLPGDYKLKVEAEGYVSATVDVNVEDENIVLDVHLDDYQVAVVGDVDGSIVELLMENDLLAEERDWDVAADVADYELVLINSGDGSVEQVEQLIAASDEHHVSTVFVGTWGAEEGSVHLLREVEGYPEMGAQGYDEGAVFVDYLADHPMFEGVASDENGQVRILAERSPYATFEGYPGKVLSNLYVDGEDKGASVGYQFRSADHMQLVLSSYAVNNMIGPDYGWTAEGKQLFVNALEWAIDAEQTAPEAPVWDDMDRVVKRPVVVSGTAEAGTMVTIKEGSDELAQVEVGEDGTFEAELELANGKHKLVAVAANFAGEAESDVLEIVVAGKPSNPGKPGKTADSSEDPDKAGNTDDLQAEVINEGVQLSWEDLGEEFYQVFRGDEKLAEVDEGSFLDADVESGETYVYRVKGKEHSWQLEVTIP
ncbi:carboxypeptidase regulatory-like domain-containing protein [Thalassobacillus hwangdonensis]|uniref:Carboxypeptidase regulatory-like domain-containing protein n=1 Tax=Thalassobacillus hwangdonensis TaxID=546108 RepID=A0ABW3L766_9BACI